MRASVTDCVRAVLRLALWTVPIPFGAFASDKGLFVSLSVLVFILASLSLPITVRRRQMKGTGTSQYASVGAILYGGIVALCVAVAILNGLMAYPFWQEYALRVASFFAWMVGTLTLQSLAAWGVDWWLKRRRVYWFSEFLDTILYSLPLPCAVMGMLLFPSVGDGEVTTSLVVGVMGIMGFGFIAMGICVIAVFAFYFLPSKGLPGKERIIQCLRIVVMTAVWLMANSIIFDSRLQIFSSLIFQCMPVVQNNFLVFITPFVVESCLVVASVAVGNVFVMAVYKFIK